MSCRTIIDKGTQYTFCPADEPTAANRQPPTANRQRAIMQGRFLDELTGREITADISVATRIEGLNPRVALGGIAGLVGSPGRLFPDLVGSPVEIDMTVTASRYIERRFQETLGPIAGFPDAFQSIDLGDVPMHRLPTVVRGRVVQSGTMPRTPLTGVTARLDGVWHTFPAADVDPLTVIEASNIASATPGLYARRTAGTDILRQRTMVLAAGEEKQLTRSQGRGSADIHLSDRVNLNIGDVLAINPAHPNLVEYIPVIAIDTASASNRPATVTLAFGLANDQKETTTVVRATPQAPGGDNALARDGTIGDQTIFLTGLIGLSGASVIEITGSGPDEYQSAALYETTSDADGYFRMPPISRVAVMRIHAERADLPQPVDFNYSPEYDLSENRADIVFS
jgi:hypothetical protein